MTNSGADPRAFEIQLAANASVADLMRAIARHLSAFHGCVTPKDICVGCRALSKTTAVLLNGSKSFGYWTDDGNGIKCASMETAVRYIYPSGSSLYYWLTGAFTRGEVVPDD